MCLSVEMPSGLISIPRRVGEQAGRRPAVVLSPSAYDDRVGLALLCPITNQRKGYPFEMRLPPKLRVTGVVRADQINSLDWRVRHAEIICALPAVTVAEVSGPAPEAVLHQTLSEAPAAGQA